MTKAMINALSDPKWVVPNLIIEGHLIAIVAEPNGGKTTIMFEQAIEMSNNGYQVTYINADLAMTEAKPFFERADENGVDLILPDLAEGQSMNGVVEDIYALSCGDSLCNEIFIFDTLKKMTDVINKSAAKKLYSILRAMTAKGATIILLAHTNKYKSEDGSPIFEGTGDLRSDVDELIYLIPEKNPDGSMTVSTSPDKIRGTFEPITFTISPMREVTLADKYVNVKANRKNKIQQAKDQDGIERITEALKTGMRTQTELINHCHNHGISKRQTPRILKQYKDELWETKQTSQNNAKKYYLI